MSLKNWIILFLIGAAFGSSFGFNEVLLSTYGPLTVSVIRLGLGALGCWIWVFSTGRAISLNGAGLLAICVFGVLQYSAPFALLPLAQGHITSSTAGIANAMTPVAVVLVSQIWPGGEKATANRIAGVALGLFGMLILTSGAGGAGTPDPVFIFVATLAPVCYAVALNMVRRFREIDPAVLTAAAMTGGVIAIIPAAIIHDGIPALPEPNIAAASVILGFGLTAATFLVMYSMLPKVGATNLSLVTLVAPVSASIIGFAVFEEPIGSSHVLGMTFIMLGLITIDGRLVRTLHKYAVIKREGKVAV